MTHQIRNCRKRLHYPKCSSTIRRLVHETDSNFVVLADEDITTTMNHPKACEDNQALICYRGGIAIHNELKIHRH